MLSGDVAEREFDYTVLRSDRLLSFRWDIGIGIVSKCVAGCVLSSMVYIESK